MRDSTYGQMGDFSARTHRRAVYRLGLVYVDFQLCAPGDGCAGSAPNWPDDGGYAETAANMSGSAAPALRL